MEFIEFVDEVVDRLSDFYGESAVVMVKDVLKINNEKLKGLHILFPEKHKEITRIIYLDSYFDRFDRGFISLEETVGEIVDAHEVDIAEIDKIANDIMHWDRIKDRVYPVLISAEDNEEFLRDKVSKKFLDLAIIYIIRDLNEADAGYKSIKITKSLLDSYGLTADELHEQALANMNEDGYVVTDMEDVLREIFCEGDNSPEIERVLNELHIMPGRMYVLRNKCKAYGAAGLLNTRLIKAVMEDKNCFVLPASVHEIIFVPIDGSAEKEDMDSMVREINDTQVEIGERLSNHAYFFDAETAEVRL